jgi:hypothetical protein
MTRQSPIDSAAIPFVNTRTPCPLCSGERVRQLPADVASSFEWQECEACFHLWALPRGWMPDAAVSVSQAGV